MKEEDAQTQAHMRAVLRLRRKALGLTQDDVAQMLGMSRITYHRIETGFRSASFKEIAGLSETLDFPVEDLLGADAARSYKSIIHKIVWRRP